MHISQSKNARTQQLRVNEKILETQASSRQKEILTWLAPTVSHIEYYIDDLATARGLRHEGTCHWILNKESFLIFLAESSSQESLLWVNAQPGAGKTIIASFLVDEFQNAKMQKHQSVVLYFFCKNTYV